MHTHRTYTHAHTQATFGDAPKFSFFGLTGGADLLSEGAAYGTDQRQDLYSPYSVYSPAGDSSLASAVDNTPQYVDMLAETQRRLSTVPDNIQRKKWFDIVDQASVRGVARAERVYADVCTTERRCVCVCPCGLQQSLCIGVFATVCGRMCYWPSLHRRLWTFAPPCLPLRTLERHRKPKR